MRTNHAVPKRSWPEAVMHYYFTDRGKFMLAKLMFRVAPSLWMPLAAVDEVVPVVGMFDDIPTALYAPYVAVQVSHHRDRRKYP